MSKWMALLGFLIVLGGVGGIEQSLDTPTLIHCTMLSLAGLALTWAGVTGMNDDSEEKSSHLS
jgi:hypothetical protein